MENLRYEALRLDNGDIVVGELLKEYGEYKIKNDDGTFLVAEASICGVGKSFSIPGNKWYRSKSQVKNLIDVVLIAKGWYDKEKYGSCLEALRVYWSGLCYCEVGYVNTDDVLRSLVFPACELFLGKDRLINIIYEKLFKNMIVFNLYDSGKLDSTMLVDFILSELVLLDKARFMVNDMNNDSMKNII